jgi:hypothetical protein
MTAGRPIPAPTTIQLAIWLDADLATRFRNHCVRNGIPLRAAAAEALAAYLELPRAGAPPETEGGLSLHLSAGGREQGEFDSHDGGRQK